MQPDDSKQREMALDPAKSFIVQSPAGSGKTELLIQRYLTLLGVVQRPEAVVAITFTRKAAGEMRRRILNALLSAAGPRPDKPHEARTWDLARAVREHSEHLQWRLLDNPARLRIQTIDSLCASITRQMPWLSRLGGPLNIVEDASELYSEAARSTLALLEDERWSADMGALLMHVDNSFQTLENLIAGMLARRDQWLRHIFSGDDPAHDRARLETALRHVIFDAVENARKTIPAEMEAEIAAVASKAGRNLESENRQEPAAACVGLTKLPDPDRLDAWLGVAGMLLTKKGEWRKKLTVSEGFPASDKEFKDRGLRLISQLAEKGVPPSFLDELRHLPDERFTEPQWQVLSALVRLLPAAAEKLKTCFREKGAADYIEVALSARKALSDSDKPTDSARSVDYPIQHILIDEFQDTSVSQYELLEALASGWTPGDGRTIFAVGDPMQSIYRFREAEVGLYLKACDKGIGKMPLDVLRLSENFRSEKGIVDWVNESFPFILPPEKDIATGAICFSPSRTAKKAGANRAVFIHPFFGDEEEEEADRIVEIIRANGQKKIAILVRARRHLARILPALRLAKIPFRAVGIDPLSEVSAIRDLMALTRALLHPADRIAWLAILRAPWCGMTLEELHAIAGGDRKEALWDLMREDPRIGQLSPEGRRRLHRVRSALEKALGERPFSLRSRIEGAWLALGGPACTEVDETENVQAFFNLLDEMDGGGVPDIEALERRIEDLYANPDPDADESLQIMSIHKAKGLEFDVVIVPGLGRETRREESRLMLWLERLRPGEKTDLLIAPIRAAGAESDKTYDYIKRIEAAKSEHETGRLLYVAATRAKSELHLSGRVKYRIGEDIPELKGPAAGSLLYRMWGVAAPVFYEAFEKFSPNLENEASRVERTPVKIRRLSLDWKMPEPPPSAAGIEKSASIEAEAGEVSFHWVGDTLRHVGTVVHQMLKHIAEEGVSRWDERRLQKGRRSYSAALAALGAPAAEIPEAAGRVAAALEKALKDDRGRWLLGPHDGAVCEYALCGVLDGRIVSARIDRTFIDGQGVRWVVDYKSSLHEGAGVEDFLDNELKRYREQLLRYRELFRLLEDRPVRAALYFPLLNAWREIEER